MASMKAMAAIALTLMVVVPIGLGYALATEKVSYSEWETESTTNISDMLLNHESPFYGDYSGTTNNTDLNGILPEYVTVGTMPTSYPAMTVTRPEVTFTKWQMMDMSSYGNWSIRVPYNLSISFDGDEWRTLSMSETITGSGGRFGIAWYTESSTRTFEVVSQIFNGNYANITDGWKLPAANTQYTWSNDQSNQTITFTMALEDNSEVRINDSWMIKRTNGEITIQFRQWPPRPEPEPIYTLGSYSVIQLVYGNGHLIVDGLNGWPAMDRVPTKYNHLDITEHITTTDKQSVYLQTTNQSNVFRVDNTTIVMGMYPTTLDKTLDLSAQFPGRSYDLNLTSIGVYGDSITLAGQSFTVENGRITVDGATVPLKGAKISTRPADGHYENAINGHALPDSNAPITVVFGGEWSLTVNADFVRESTGERTQWAAGQFAFDKEDFAACGLLVCAACLLGLGAMGRRSGIKFAFLAFVLGGAAIGYLILI